MERWRKTESSISLIVPFMPSNNRSFGEAGSYTPSSSTMTVPTRPQNSRRVCQSRPLRARRDASTDMTAPTRPSQIAASSLSKPGRLTPPAGSTQVVVDDLDVVPAQQSRSLGKAVLSTLALQIVGDLLGCRLADVYDGAARKMIKRYLRHRAPPLDS